MRPVTHLSHTFFRMNLYLTHRGHEWIRIPYLPNSSIIWHRISFKYLIPFNSFENSPLPKDIDEYMLYKKNMTNFVNTRNQRILNLK